MKDTYIIVHHLIKDECLYGNKNHNFYSNLVKSKKYNSLNSIAAYDIALYLDLTLHYYCTIIIAIIPMP